MQMFLQRIIAYGMQILTVWLWIEYVSSILKPVLIFDASSPFGFLSFQASLAPPPPPPISRSTRSPSDLDPDGVDSTINSVSIYFTFITIFILSSYSIFMLTRQMAFSYTSRFCSLSSSYILRRLITSHQSRVSIGLVTLHQWVMLSMHLITC